MSPSETECAASGIGVFAAEEDARAERVANAAATLLVPESDSPADGSGQPPTDGRPTGIQFEGLSNNTELGSEDVPASVYIAAAGSAPSATEEQLEAAEELMTVCDGQCVSLALLPS